MKDSRTVFIVRDEDREVTRACSTLRRAKAAIKAMPGYRPSGKWKQSKASEDNPQDWHYSHGVGQGGTFVVETLQIDVGYA